MANPIKAKALGQKFRAGYSLLWPFIVRASREFHAYCLEADFFNRRKMFALS